MSSKMLPSSRKPPLARSPIRLRLRPRPPLQSTPGSLAKTQLSESAREIEEAVVRPEYRTISCELKALAKMVRQEFSPGDPTGLVSSLSGNRSPLFERGRFYDEYSARRNERLRRKKKGETGGDEKKSAAYDLGVRVESTKRRGETKRFESLRKTVPCTPMTEERNQASSSRYLLRSSTVSKENKKPPPLPLAAAGFGGKKTSVVMRGRKI